MPNLKDSKFLTPWDFQRRLQTALTNADAAEVVFDDFRSNSLLSYVLYGIGAGIFMFSRQCQKALNNTFIESASGAGLDYIAKQTLNMTRRGASGSSVIITIVPTSPGTLQKGTTFTSKEGNKYTYVGPTISVEFPTYITAGSAGTGSESHCAVNSIVSSNPNIATWASFSNQSSSIGGFDVETDDEFIERLKSEFSKFGASQQDKTMRMIQERFSQVERIDSFPSSFNNIVFVLKRDASDVTDVEKSEIASFFTEKFSADGLSVEVEPMPKILDPVKVRVSNSESNYDEVRNKVSIATMIHLDPRKGLKNFEPADLRDTIENLYPELNTVEVITPSFPISGSLIYHPRAVDIV